MPKFSFKLVDGTFYHSDHDFETLVTSGILTVKESAVNAEFEAALEECRWRVALDAWAFHLKTNMIEHTSVFRMSPEMVQDADDIIACCVMLAERDAKYYSPRESTSHRKNFAVRDLLGAETPVARRIIQTSGLYLSDLWPAIGPTYEELMAERAKHGAQRR